MVLRIDSNIKAKERINRRILLPPINLKHFIKGIVKEDKIGINKEIAKEDFSSQETKGELNNMMKNKDSKPEDKILMMINKDYPVEVEGLIEAEEMKEVEVKLEVNQAV